jgi:hypothetical protein
VKHRFFGVHNTVNLRVKRHDLEEAVGARAYTRLPHLLLIGFLALEHAPELKLLLACVFLKLGLPARLTGHLLAARVHNGLTCLEVETLQTTVTCYILELFHTVTC